MTWAPTLGHLRELIHRGEGSETILTELGGGHRRLHVETLKFVYALYSENLKLAQQRGIDRAKGDGRYVGRAARFNGDFESIRAAHAGGESVSSIASRYGMSRTYVYKILRRPQ